jgi:Radical SAM superfamily/4Fe-4S single cluster domain
MKLSGLHLLLTYQCNFECDHCFLWGGPHQIGTMTMEQIEEIIQQAKRHGSVEWFYFEGGEPFLYYPVLVEAVRRASQSGFNVGVVTNSYWATSLTDALIWLKPFSGLLQDLSVSTDLFHGSEMYSDNARFANQAAEILKIPVGTIQIAQPEEENVACSVGKLPEGGSKVMFRGRAASTLASKAAKRPWTEFHDCPHENLSDPGRVHVDPLGYLHVCQGITIGNLFEHPVNDICANFQPEHHPILGPLLADGPVGLASTYGVTPEELYADACHLCYSIRDSLRDQFPNKLGPGQMYGDYV